MSPREQILKHYEDVWRNKGEARYWYKGPVGKLHPDFCLFEFGPSKTRDMWTYATCCMSHANDHNPVELHMFSNRRDNSLVELLTVVAHYSKNESTIGLHHTVNFGRPWQDDSKCEFGLISLPFLDGQALEDAQIDDYNGAVKFYWLIPVTKEEVEFKKTHGIEGLEEKFEGVGLDYINPKRLSAV